jgi:hypothetical protein
MVSKTLSKLIVLPLLYFHIAPLVVMNEPSQPFAFTGDVVGDQMPQTMQHPARALDLLPRAVKIVAKLAE